MKKIIYIYILFISLVSYSYTNAYTSEDIVNIYYQGDTTPATIYTIPDGYDVYINSIRVDNLNGILGLYDSGSIVSYGDVKEHNNSVGLLFTSTIDAVDSSSAYNYVISGYLVREGIDISYLTSPDAERGVFAIEDIEEIYLYEAILMVIIIFINFMLRIFGIRKPKKSLFYKF